MSERDKLFCHIADAMLRQGRQSVDDNGMCVYRGPGGLRCAVGHLIADEEYSLAMEGLSVEALAKRSLPPKRLMPYESMLCRLQNIHDLYDVDTFGWMLEKLAFELGIDYNQHHHPYAAHVEGMRSGAYEAYDDGWNKGYYHEHVEGLRSGTIAHLLATDPLNPDSPYAAHNECRYGYTEADVEESGR